MKNDKERKTPFHNHGAKLVRGEARNCQECINKTFLAVLENTTKPEQPVPLKDSSSDYVILAAPKVVCPYAHVLHAKHPDVLHHIMHLQPEALFSHAGGKELLRDELIMPQFYICFNCNRVFEVGKGEVTKI